MRIDELRYPSAEEQCWSSGDRLLKDTSQRFGLVLRGRCSLTVRLERSLSNRQVSVCDIDVSSKLTCIFSFRCVRRVATKFEGDRLDFLRITEKNNLAGRALPHAYTLT